MNLRIFGDLAYFWEWDLGRKLVVDDNGICSQVHFCSGPGDALVCTVREEEGLRVVDVPNILLQTAGVIQAYLYTEAADGSRTRSAHRFRVLPRAKPEEYIYTETEVLNYKYLDDRLNYLEGDGLDRAVVQALIEAKLSGQFDGDPGVYTLAEGETLADAPAWAEVVVDPFTDPRLGVDDLDMDAIKQELAGEFADPDAVRFVPQELTDAQAMQARENINAVAPGAVDTAIRKALENLPSPDFEAPPGTPGHILNRTHWADPAILFPETLLDNDNGWDEIELWFCLDLALNLVAGETYTITINGQSATVVADDGTFFDDFPATYGAAEGFEIWSGAVVADLFGYNTALSIPASVSDEALGDGYACIPTTVSVTGAGAVHKLDTKYLELDEIAAGLPTAEMTATLEDGTTKTYKLVVTG